MRRNLILHLGTDSEEFKHYVGRKLTRKEMDKWVHLLTNGVRSQLDWEIINQCAKEEFKP